MKKVYYWCPFISKVATVKAVINSCKGLMKYNKDFYPVIINCFGEFDEYEDELIKNKITVIKLINNNIIKKISSDGFLFSRIKYILIFILSFRKLSKLIKKNEPEFFISHLITSLPLFLFLLNNFKTKLILRISGLPKLNYFRYLFWKICASKINLVTTPTEGTYKNIIKSRVFLYGKVKILEDPVLNFKEVLKKRKEIITFKNFEKEKYLLAIGRLTRQKNFSLLINFFKLIHNNENDCKLVIVGVGEEEYKLKKMIKKYRLENKVIFAGYKKNVFKYLFNSKLFILTSKWEDPGFVLIEAGACRASILSSDCPNGPKEFLNDGSGGYLFLNNNINDLKLKYEKYKNDSSVEKKNKKIITLKETKKYTIFRHTQKLSFILKNINI